MLPAHTAPLTMRLAHFRNIMMRFRARAAFGTQLSGIGTSSLEGQGGPVGPPGAVGDLAYQRAKAHTMARLAQLAVEATSAAQVEQTSEAAAVADTGRPEGRPVDSRRARAPLRVSPGSR